MVPAEEKRKFEQNRYLHLSVDTNIIFADSVMYRAENQANNYLLLHKVGRSHSPSRLELVVVGSLQRVHAHPAPGAASAVAPPLPPLAAAPLLELPVPARLFPRRLRVKIRFRLRI